MQWDFSVQMIRDHFLLQLNGQFQGKATGRLFNASAKPTFC